MEVMVATAAAVAAVAAGYSDGGMMRGRGGEGRSSLSWYEHT
jgi:hypothetical protein